MTLRRYLCPLALALALPVALFAQTAAQLLQEAARMEQAANECRAQADHYARSNVSSEATRFRQQEQVYRSGAAQLRAKAAGMGASGAIPGGMSGGSAGTLGQLQNVTGMGMDLMRMRDARLAREAAAQADAEAAAAQREYERQAAEAARAAAAAEKTLNEQRQLEAARAQYGSFYDLDKLDAAARAAPAGSGLATWTFPNSAPNPQRAVRHVEEVLGLSGNLTAPGSLQPTAAARAAKQVDDVIGPAKSPDQGVFSAATAVALSTSNALEAGKIVPKPIAMTTSDRRQVTVTPTNVHSELRSVQDYAVLRNHFVPNDPATHWVQMAVPPEVIEAGKDSAQKAREGAIRMILDVIEKPGESAKPARPAPASVGTGGRS